MASLQAALGDYESALQTAERCIELRREVLGEDHPDTLESLSAAAGYHERLGNLEQAVRLYEESIAVQTRVLGADHLETIFSGANLALLYLDHGEIDLAEPRVMKLRAYFAERMGEEHGWTRLTDFHVGRVHNARQRWSEAEKSIRLALSEEDGDPLSKASMEIELAIALSGQLRFSEAESLLLTAHRTIEGLDRGLDAARYRRQGLEALVSLYQAWNRADEARHWMAELKRDA